MTQSFAHRFRWTILAAGATAGMFCLFQLPLARTMRAAEPADAATSGKGSVEHQDNLPSNVGEARSRARVLHETIHGSLQVMHRDFFREDEGLPIPSHSLEDVFQELARLHDVHLRWLAVNARAMNIDHNPKSEFDKSAARALASGQVEFESSTAGAYQYVGAIRLSATCLKCHLPGRTSNDDRLAALVIRMPLRSSAPKPVPPSE